jgi:hypothetical protein
MLNVNMLSVVMLNAVKLSVMAPQHWLFHLKITDESEIDEFCIFTAAIKRRKTFFPQKTC